MITGWNPDLFQYLGDVYENGSFQEFTDWYDPFWGQLRGVSDPTIGNHEYQIDSAASGYACIGIISPPITATTRAAGISSR